MTFSSRIHIFGNRVFSPLIPRLGAALLVLVLAATVGCGGSEPAPPQPQAQPAEPTAGTQETSPAAAPTLAPAMQETGSPPATAVPGPETATGPTAAAGAAPAPQAAPTAVSTAAPAPPATEQVAEQAPQPTAEPTAEPAAEPAAEPESTAPAEPAEPSEPPGPGGEAYVIGEGSKATFTVNEKLAWLDLPNDAVMHTEGLTGSIYLDGQPSVIDLDLHSMTSDSDRRDGYVRNRMFPDHRVATFTVADLGDLPDPLPEGEVISREVQGELTIREVTRPITFDVQARRDPDKLFILGRTTFTWADLDIPPPNIPGRIQVKDEVQVEVLLSATPAGG